MTTPQPIPGPPPVDEHALLTLIARYCSIVDDACDLRDAITETLVASGFAVYDADELRWCAICGAPVLPSDPFWTREELRVCDRCAGLPDEDFNDMAVHLKAGA